MSGFTTVYGMAAPLAKGQIRIQCPKKTRLAAFTCRASQRFEQVVHRLAKAPKAQPSHLSKTPSVMETLRKTPAQFSSAWAYSVLNNCTCKNSGHVSGTSCLILFGTCIP